MKCHPDSAQRHALLILGLWPRWISLGSAALLAMFGTAMAISFGLKSQMDYSVYSASGGAVLLALHAFRQSSKTISPLLGKQNHEAKVEV